MLIVISPAKKLDFESPSRTTTYTSPEFLPDAKQLVATLRKLSGQDLADLMKSSIRLGELNFERYKRWKLPFSLANAKQAILAFKGDVYAGLDVESFGVRDFGFAQQHLRILSGLYGVLRPLDLIQPYRLEMGTRLKTDKGKDLYAFWGSKITDSINRELGAQKDKILINLASNEYFKAIQPQRVEGTVITPVFKELRGGRYKVIGLLAKKARGMMSNYIIKNRLKNVDDIKSFATESYRFNTPLSKDNEWVFTRDLAVAA